MCRLTVVVHVMSYHLSGQGFGPLLMTYYLSATYTNVPLTKRRMVHKIKPDLIKGALITYGAGVRPDSQDQHMQKLRLTPSLGVST